jgi:hypothetical protein
VWVVRTSVFGKCFHVIKLKVLQHLQLMSTEVSSLYISHIAYGHEIILHIAYGHKTI